MNTKIKFDMNDIYQVANSVLFCEDMLMCAERLDRFLQLIEGCKNKRGPIDKLLKYIKNGAIGFGRIPSPLKRKKKESFKIITGSQVVNCYLTMSPYLTNALSPQERLVAISELSEHIKSYFTKPVGPRVKESFIYEAMNYLDDQFSFSESIFDRSGQLPAFLLYDNSTIKHNSGCRVITRGTDKLYYIDLFHLKADVIDTPEYILFHELGHVVQAAYYDLNSAPQSFLALDVNEPFRDESLHEQRELFANAFAMVAIRDNRFPQYAPSDFCNTPPEIIQVLDKYFHNLIH